MTHSNYVRLVRIPLLTLLTLLAVMGIFSKRGLMDRARILNQNRDMETRLFELTTKKGDLDRQLSALKSNPAEQERVIRQILGYVKPNETVVEFP